MDRLFLIGYRGAGKTAVAPLVAAKLGWSWSDADQVLEARHGKSIGQIFVEEGEAGFRQKESLILRDLCKSVKTVIATGGGVVLSTANRNTIRTGKVIWLTADAETLWRRLEDDSTPGSQRPILAEGGFAEIERLLRNRCPLYAACADFMIDTSHATAETAADTLVEWLQTANFKPSDAR